MLIGSGVKAQYNNLEPPNFDSSSISSEAESVDDVWSITEEQREYYMNQFKTMQPDLGAVIIGMLVHKKEITLRALPKEISLALPYVEKGPKGLKVTFLVI